MAVIRQTYYIYQRNLRLWVTQPAALIPPFFISGLLFVVFGSSFGDVTNLAGFPAEDYTAFLTAMILVQAMVFSGGDAGFSMLTDMLSGYFDKLLVAPINRFSILLGSLLVTGTRSFAQSVIIVLLALAMGVSFKGGSLGIVAVVLITTVFGIAWGCLGLIIALRTKSVQATQSSFVLFFPFIFMTTAFMPKEFLPYWFQIATTINPVTYVLEAVRAIIVEGWVWSTVGLGVGLLAAFTAFLLSLTTWLYNRQTA